MCESITLVYKLCFHMNHFLGSEMLLTCWTYAYWPAIYDNHSPTKQLRFFTYALTQSRYISFKI